MASPATGLIIFLTDSVAGVYYNTGTPAAPVWDRMLTSASDSGWLLSGNGGTTPGTHFIGTTDANGLQFKINNTYAGLLDSDRSFLGY